MERAKHFYADVLGFEIKENAGPTAEVLVKSADGTEFALYERPGMPAPQNTTLAFVVDDFDGAASELRSKGVTFEEYDIPEIGLKTVDGVAEMEGSKASWFKDTEGNIIVMSSM
ncbi:MAG: VOC family protein [Coriobacteriales bacterium]|nr:VOC family protein [Coriobacteriales bacterium]